MKIELIRALGVLILSSMGTVLPAEGQTGDWMPLENRDYWSFVGEVRSEGGETSLLLRQQVDATVYISGKRSYRTMQNVLPALSDSVSDLGAMDRKWYQNTQSGWYVFREESANQVMDYERSARILPEQFELGRSYKYKTRLSSESGRFGIISYQAVPVGIETITIPNGDFEALKVNVEKRSKYASDAKLEEVTEEVTEFYSNWYVQNVGLVKQEGSQASVSGSESRSLSYEVALVASRYLPNYLWPDAELGEDGWRLVPWLGYLTDHHFPWVFHAEHGWLFVDAQDVTDVRLWSEDLGWWFTSADLYPLFYSHDLGEWLTFEGGSRSSRRFVREDGSVVTVSQKGFLSRSRAQSPPSVKVGSDAPVSGSLTFLDADGNRYTNTDSGLEKDSGQAPEVSILHPFQGASAKEGERLLILADAKDSDGVIRWVKVFVNGSLYAVMEKAPYQTILDVDGSEESYAIVVVARDNYGNETSSSSLSVPVELKEKILPKVRIASPMNRSWFALGSRVEVEVVASDADGFVESVALLVDGVQVGETQNRAPYVFEFTPPVAGSYQLGALAVDDDGNEANAVVVTVSVNRSGLPDSELRFPDVVVSSPLNGQRFVAGSPIAITVHASDEDGVVDQVRVFANGQQIGPTMDRSPYSVTYYPPSGLTGSIQIQAKARDNDWQESQSSVSVTLVSE
jgi:hypothetical protein